MSEMEVRATSLDEMVQIPQQRGSLGLAQRRTPAPRDPAPSLLSRASDLDRRLADVLRPHTLRVLQVLLGLLFVWFGALKVFGVSPVGDLVAGTLPWVDREVLVPALGGVELVLGLGLATGVLLRVVLPVLALHLLGTFLTFVMVPATMFHDHNPMLLTAAGEFVVKNLVLVSATLVLIAHSHVARTHDPLEAAL